jgi:glycosyltransferase involved in cell wall biosynthesis
MKPDITIAVTVFDRRTYLIDAIASALEQTLPASRVFVLEDHGPDPGLADFVCNSFGRRVEYLRNPSRRGLFDNWNACIEHCSTKWLSILHDDDLLRPGFVASMGQLMEQHPDRGLYFGQTEEIDSTGLVMGRAGVACPDGTPYRDVPLDMFLMDNPLSFPGQVFDVSLARELGGFRRYSQFCGDWEMWARLCAARGAAQTADVVSSYRQHPALSRGTTRVERNGKRYGLVNVQRKRVARLLRRSGGFAETRRGALEFQPLPSRILIRNAREMTSRILGYNTQLFLDSRAPNVGYKMLQWVTRLMGSAVFRAASRLSLVR